MQQALAKCLPHHGYKKVRDEVRGNRTCENLVLEENSQTFRFRAVGNSTMPPRRTQTCGTLHLVSGRSVTASLVATSAEGLYSNSILRYDIKHYTMIAAVGRPSFGAQGPLSAKEHHDLVSNGTCALGFIT
jgi:hypothetical protein